MIVNRAGSTTRGWVKTLEFNCKGNVVTKSEGKTKGWSIWCVICGIMAVICIIRSKSSRKKIVDKQ